MSNELTKIKQKVAEAEKRKAVAEAQRDRAKKDLKDALQQAADEFGVTSLVDLEKKVDEVRAERDKALEALQQAVRDL